MAQLRRNVVGRPLGFAILIGAVIAVPLVSWAVEMGRGGFPDSGRIVGTFSLVLIAGTLGLVFSPAAWAVLRDDLVPTKQIGLFALTLAAAHAVAFVGVTVSESNMYFLSYPMGSVIGTYASLRISASESDGAGREPQA